MMSGVKLPKRLSVPQQRMLFESLSPMDKQHIRTAFMTHNAQNGGKFIDNLKSFTKKAGLYTTKAINDTIIPVLKYLGPTVLKEIVLTLAKKKIGLGISPAGMGLKLAGQGKPKKVGKKKRPKKKHCDCITKS